MTATGPWETPSPLLLSIIWRNIFYCRSRSHAMASINELLTAFRDAHSLKGKGQLALMLHVTRLAAELGLPLDAGNLLTNKEGQIRGLGKGRIQSILSTHGITRVLAEEGGRTSRGSLGNAFAYAQFLNDLHKENMADLSVIEQWWIARVMDFFNSKPFKLTFDSSKSLRGIVTDLINQAVKRQKDNPGTTYIGTMLQHLVGAKLDLILPDAQNVIHYGANVADIPTSRAGDFVLDDVAIHVTSSPTEALIRKCKANIEAGLKPVIISIYESRAGIESIAKGFDIQERIEVLEIEQFLATNLLEWSSFANVNYKNEIKKLISKYNEIIDSVETDKSLKIEF